MIPASPAPTIAAAMAFRARRRIVDHFFVHHATSAEDAVAYQPQRLIERRQFERMQRSGVIRDGRGGQYWIDTAAYQATTETRRKRLVGIAFVLILIAAVVPLFFYKG